MLLAPAPADGEIGIDPDQNLTWGTGALANIALKEVKFPGSVPGSDSEPTSVKGAIAGLKAAMVSYVADPANPDTLTALNAALSAYNSAIDDARAAGNLGTIRFVGSVTLNASSDDQRLELEGGKGASFDIAAGATLTIKGNNHPLSGGALYVGTGDLLAVTGGGAIVLEGNTAKRDGGGLYNAGTVSFAGPALFKGNKKTDDLNYGGGLYNAGIVSFLGAATFADNKTEGASADGGGLYNSNGGTISFAGPAAFTGNTAKHDGGGLRNSGEGTISFAGPAAFTGNTAEDGGGAYNYGGTLIFAGPALFTGNTATSSGGGLSSSGDGTLRFAGPATFTGNKATGYGGGLNNSGKGLSFAGPATFTGNEGLRGGGLYNTGTVSFLDAATFADNKAEGDRAHGGGLYNENGTLSFAGPAAFTGNTTKGRGGGLYNDKGTLSFAGPATFTGNTAEDQGGGIYNDAGSVTFNGPATFTGNTATRNGGGLYNDGTLSFAGPATFTGNEATGDGGGLYSAGSGASFDGPLTFTGNKGRRGGGLYNSGGVTLSFDVPLAFTGNEATEYGGGIYNNSTLIFAGPATFTGNTAKGNSAHGGGIYHIGQRLSLEPAKASDTILFSGNTAGGKPNAIYIKAGNPLNVGGAGTVDLRDPMTGDVDNGTIQLSKAGTGTWYLGGDNAFTQANTGSTNFTVSGGILHLYRAGEVDNPAYADGKVATGTISLAGAASSFNLKAGATLSVGGSGHTITTAGTINLETGSTLGFDLAQHAANANTPMLMLSGAVSVDGPIGINLLSLLPQGHTLVNNYVTLVSGGDFSAVGTGVTPTYKGEALADTAAGGLVSVTGSNLALALEQTDGIPNQAAIWANKSGNGKWDFSSANWLNSQSQPYKFWDGDAVTFTADSAADISINPHGVRVADMILTGGAYTFTGGSITAATSVTTITDASGKLSISGGSANFTGLSGNNSFGGGIDISGGKLLVANAQQLGTSLSKLFFTGEVEPALGQAATALKNAIIDNSGIAGALDAYNTAVNTAKSDDKLGVLHFAGPVTLDSGGGSAQRLNVGATAGSIEIAAGATLRLTGNSSADNGGALYVSTNGLLAVTGEGDIVFEGNASTLNVGNSGGGLSNWGTLSFAGPATFTSNTSSLDGGGLYNWGTLSFAGPASFTGNRAGSGGGLHNAYQLSFAGPATFTGNTAGSGGGLYNWGTLSFAGPASFTGNTATSKGGGLYNDYQLSFAGPATFTGNTASFGGGLYNENGTVSFAGPATFTGNTATSKGGGLYSLGTLNLQPTKASDVILFSGNTAGGNPNAIHIEASSSLNVGGAGTVDLRDPMSGNAANASTLSINKSGTSAWRLSGDNAFTQAGSGKISFTVSGGTLHLYRAGEASDQYAAPTTGTISLAGAASSFNLEAGGTLSLGGVGHSLTTDGSINLETGSTLAFDMTGAQNDGSTTNLSLAAGTISGSIGAGDIKLINFSAPAAAGTVYTLVDTGTAGATTHSGNLYVNGTLHIPQRSTNAGALMYGLTTDAEGKKLQIQSASASVNSSDLSWAGTVNDAWNIANTANWQGSAGDIGVKTFLNGDTVSFDATAEANKRAVSVDAAGVTVAGMTVSGSGYTFSGGKISGTGALKIDESATFYNQFDGFSGATIANNKVLTIDTSAGWTLTTALSGGGSLKKAGEGTLKGLGGFTGAVEIAGGTLEISSASFGNVLTGTGVLAANLADADNAFSFEAGAGSAFTGTLEMLKGSISLDNEHNYAVLQNAGLRLGAAGSTTVTRDRDIKSLTLDGGTLRFAVNSITPGGVLSVGTLDATGGGVIRLDLNKAAVITGDEAQSLYDYATAASAAQQKLIAVSNTPIPGASLLVWKDYNGLDLAATQSRDIQESGIKTGVASFDYLGTAKTDGLYLGYGLTQIEALAGQSVSLDSSDATAATPTINAKLTGAGAFTFSGTADVEVGNAASDYTGATEIENAHTVSMLANNAFGATSSLTLSDSAKLDMNGKSQTLASIHVANGTEIVVANLNVSNGTIAGTLSGNGTTTQNGGTLAYSGNQTSGSFVQTDGIFNSADGATLNSATFKGKVTPLGTLNITGNASFDGAELDFGLLTQGNKIALGGKAGIKDVSAQLDAAGIINSTAYTLLEYDSYEISGMTTTLVLNLGENRGGGYFDATKKALKYEVIVGNTSLSWQGSSNTWKHDDKTNINWSAGNINTYFKNGDSVIFDDSSANKDVIVASGGVSVGSMEVNGNYNFSGGTITAGAVSIAAGKSLGLAIADNATPILKAASVDFNSSSLNITGYTPGKTTQFTSPFQTATVIRTSGGVQNFNPAVTVLSQASVDFLSASARLSDDGRDVLVETGLTWYSSDPNRPAHGDFTIADGESFTLGADLINNSSSGNKKGDWDGNSLTKKGEGSLILTGDNTYSGGTTVAGGTLQIGDGGTKGSISGDIKNDSELVFKRSDDVTYSDVISGTGSVTKDGSGDLILTGDNTYSGGTTVADGTLQIGDGGTNGSISGDIKNDSELVFKRSDDVTYSDVISGTGSVTKDGSGDLTLTGNNSYSGGTTVADGALLAKDKDALGTGDVATTGNGTLVLDFEGEFENNISGTGNVEIAGAGVIINNSANVAMDVSGTLGGSSTYKSIKVQNGGTLSPGDGGLGTITTGSLTLEAGSVYEVEVEPGGTNSDLIVVTGTASLAGATVKHIGLAENGGKYSPIGEWTILTAGDDLTDEFSGVERGYAFLDASLLYGQKDVKLRLERNDVDFAAKGQSPNQRAVARGIESQGAGSQPYNYVSSQLNTADMGAIYNALSGEVHASLPGQLMSMDKSFAESWKGRMAAKAPAVGSYPGLAKARASFAGARSYADAHGGLLGSPTDFWFSIDGYKSDSDGNSNSSKAELDGWGLSFGFEKELEKWLLGAAFRYGDSDYEVKGLGSEADLESFNFGLYGGRRVNDFSLKFGAGYGLHQVDSTRSVRLAGLSQSLSADYKAHSLQLFTELGYVKAFGPLSLEPYLGLAWNWAKSESFSEKGGSAALRVKSRSNDNISSSLGLRGQYQLAEQLSLNAHLDWEHLFGDREPQARLAFAGGDSFTVMGVPQDRDSLGLGLDLSARLRENLSLGIGYLGRFGEKTNAHRGFLKIEFKF